MWGILDVAESPKREPSVSPYVETGEGQIGSHPIQSRDQPIMDGTFDGSFDHCNLENWVRRR